MDGGDVATELLWGGPAAPRRGPRPTLTLDAIARAGIAAADADGLAAVTMQRVADALDVTKMALYRYVPGKTELVALMIDAGVGEPPPVGAVRPGDWRSALADWSRALYAAFYRHPWALEAAVGVRAMGPNELGWMERAVAALAGTGLDGGEMLDVVVTLVGHVRNLAAQTAAAAGPGGAGQAPVPASARRASSRAPERAARRAPEQAVEPAMEQALTALVRGREDRFPALTAALASAVAHGSQDQALDFGLNLILDGVAALIAARSRA